MKIVVLVKEVPEPGSRIVLRDGQTIDDTAVRFVINPHDQCALEEALRLKEELGGEVVVMSVGREESESTVRDALTLGADRATLIVAATKDAAAVSRLLAENIELEGDYDLIISGWVAEDDNEAQVPGRISQLLGLPFINVATNVQVTGRSVSCEREWDGRMERVEVPLPAVVAVDKGINVPRLPTIANILRANRLPLKKLVAPATYSQQQGRFVYQLRHGQRKGVILNMASLDEKVSLLAGVILREKL